MKLGIKIDGNKTGGHVQKEREREREREREVECASRGERTKLKNMCVYNSTS